jgi:Tol biopolymer transport system component/predicted Ser/Thr protein kinase
MSLSAGTRLGPYEIVMRIGAGGMGEVYRARDTRLNRDVAIKVSAAQFSERFDREARVVASLNHSNICSLYDVGPNYLVMELVEGENLKGPLPLDTALEYARQIADALEAAHEKGIVHRDLKPANIKIKPDGKVKVLDFGLAKITETPGEDGSTVTMGATQAGVILGTAPYMSPEQARGKTVDQRADIWAFGVVVYEMLTGERLFTGETITDTLAAVVMKTPDWERAPVQVRRVLKACLEKDAKKRLQAIGDWRLLLDSADESEVTAPLRSRLGWASWAVAAVVTLALGALAWVHFREQPPVAEVTRFQISLPANEILLVPYAPQEVSPDGRKLAFVTRSADGKRHMWIRSFDALDARLLAGVDPANTPSPGFWSFDSRFLAFQSSDNKLKKVDVSGGPAQTLCDAGTVLGGSWSRDGVILFAEPSRGVMRVSEAGGTATALTALDPTRQERGHLFPTLLPDGRHFLYFRDSSTPENSGIYVGAIDAEPSQQSSKPLLMNPVMPAYYVPTGSSGKGYLLFYREGTVLAQEFNPNKLELSGDPVPVAEQVGSFQGLIGFFSASNNGVLTYAGGTGGAGNTQLTWFDRQGRNLGTVGDPGLFSDVALSTDGKQAAVARIDFQTRRQGNLWLLDLTRGGASTRFTFDASVDDFPIFSPDGSRIVFASTRDGTRNLYQKFTSGVKDEEPVLKSDEGKHPYSWSRDGRFLLYSVVTPKTKTDVWILLMDGSQKRMPFQATEFNEDAAQFSPDGRWIAYQSDESGRSEVYVREFSLGSDGKPEATAKHQISAGGGTATDWRDDGKELIYLSLDQRTWMSVAIATKPVFQASPAKALGQLPSGITAGAVTADGQRFLVAAPANQSGPQQFTVVLNWPAAVRK